jgi:large subunit ribosomal protein L7/L12
MTSTSLTFLLSRCCILSFIMQSVAACLRQACLRKSVRSNRLRLVHQPWSRRLSQPSAAAAATSAATSASPPPPPPFPFEYPKAQALFEKITATLSTVEQVRALQREMYTLLGRPLRETEFYYDGFGSKRKSGGSGGATAAGEAAPVAQVKTVFDVKLMGFDASAKIKVIKKIRSVAGLGLKEAKDLVESAPCIISKGIKTEAAEELKAKLVELGAQIEIV